MHCSTSGDMKNQLYQALNGFYFASSKEKVLLMVSCEN